MSVGRAARQVRHAAANPFRSIHSATAWKTTMPILRGADVSFDYRAGNKVGHDERTFECSLPLQKFPVLLSREFCCKALNLLACRLSKLHLRDEFDEIPC